MRVAEPVTAGRLFPAALAAACLLAPPVGTRPAEAQGLGAAAARNKAKRQDAPPGASPARVFGDAELKETGWTGWQKWKAPDGSFTVSLPARPTQVDESLETKLGPIVRRTYRVEREGLTYSVSVTDYPVPYVTYRGTEPLLDDVQRQTVKAAAGTLQGQKKMALAASPGREFTYSTANARYATVSAINRVYLVGSRVYLLSATSSPDAPPGYSPDSLLESFELAALGPR